MVSPRRSLAYGLTANVVVLGVVSLFTDISSEMILPILPFFLIQVLGANALILGIEEGLSDSVVSFMKIFSGRFSDAAGKRKRFVGAGYALSTLMKVLFPFAQSWPEFIGMRIVERTGKGVRDAPRDALLTESTPAETRGKAFGFHRSMDTTGAIAGPIITLVLLATIAAAPVPNYRLILILAAFAAGMWSDGGGRKPVVLTGYFAFIAMATLLVFSDLLAVLVLAFVLYGLSYGMAEGTQRALVADFAPPDIKATVLGAYHTCVGAVKLASGVVAGLLWIAFAPTPTFPVGAATFAFGAIAATVAAIGLSLWKAPARS